MELDQQNFSWKRVRDLFGVPYRDPRIQELFSRVNLNPDELWREVRVGIYSMPPHDQQPSPVAEIDLIPSYRVRLRFRHAALVKGAAAASPTTFVFSGITYFLEYEDGLEPFLGGLPHGIRPTDDLDAIVEHVGSPPTGRHFKQGEDDGYVIWEDRNPILHVLFSTKEKRPLRVNVYLAPSDPEGKSPKSPMTPESPKNSGQTSS
jgi:hypothetical protein